MSDENERYWTLDAANESNKIEEAQRATGMELVALVDEQAGGVIGYVLDDEAGGITRLLNDWRTGVFIALSEGAPYGVYADIGTVVTHLGVERGAMAQRAFESAGEPITDEFGLTLTYRTIER